jgi:hypothetical protein
VEQNNPGLSHTMEYQHIDQALRSNWSPFQKLQAEMESFQPRPLESFQELYESEVRRITALNPKGDRNEIENIVRHQINSMADPGWQFYRAFDSRLMSQYVTVVMLSHALCEALINVLLAIGLTNSNTTELFSILDKADFKQKWLTAPKALNSSYEFPKSTAIYESLVKLACQRNALVHYKVQVHVNGVKALDGSGFERRAYKEELSWLRRFFSLPYDLADFTRKAMPENFHIILLERHPIEVAPEHVNSPP